MIVAGNRSLDSVESGRHQIVGGRSHAQLKRQHDRLMHLAKPTFARETNNPGFACPTIVSLKAKELLVETQRSK